MDGIAATRVIRAEPPEVKVVALTGVSEGACGSGAVRATGRLLEDTDADEPGEEHW